MRFIRYSMVGGPKRAQAAGRGGPVGRRRASGGRRRAEAASGGARAWGNAWRSVIAAGRRVPMARD